MPRFFSLPLSTLFFLGALLLTTAAGAADSDRAITHSGTIIETFNVSGYTYMNIETEGDKLWVAIPESAVSSGEKVTFAEGMVMKNFHSKALDKTFESIIFSPGLIEDAPSSEPAVAASSDSGSSFSEAVKKEAAQQPAKQLEATSAGSAGATVPFLEITVEKATGDNGRTVEEIFSQAEQLHGSVVRVRGKVVKLNSNIMGRNWIHLQDGTGDPMKNTHDLVVTSSEETVIDSIVLVEGKVSAKMDFGFGYKYDVLIEEASILQ